MNGTDGGPPPAEDAAQAAEALFGDPVDRITAPGGRRRASVRVHLGGRSVIASWRADPARRAREIALLEALAREDAPVPRFLGQSRGWSFQSDAGNRRLTAELERQDAQGRETVAAAALESLLQIKRAARRRGLVADLPPIANGSEWLGRFARGLVRLAERLGIPAPDYDAAALARGLTSLPLTFIKWDARPGNAAIAADGRVIWFDWEDYGRRAGVEDAAFLVADEFWPLPADSSRDLLRRTGFVAPGHEPLFIRFAVLQGIERCRLILGQQGRHGWQDAARMRRYDRIGVSRELALRVTATAAALAGMDGAAQPLARWLDHAAMALPE